jgi:hypothetical protein
MYTACRRCEDWPEFEIERKATKQIAPMYTAPIYIAAYCSYVYSILLVTASCCAQAQVQAACVGVSGDSLVLEDVLWRQFPAVVLRDAGTRCRA